MSTVDVAELARELELTGIAGHEAAIRAVAQAARAQGVSPVLVGILTDRGEPEVVRLRAFGHVAAALAFGRPTAPTAPPTLAAA